MDNSIDTRVADLDRRVTALESNSAPAAKPPAVDAKATDPPPPNGVAHSAWMVFEIIGEFKLLLSMLFDRGYHMGWLTRFLVLFLLVAILTSHWWAPFAVYDNFLSNMWDKLIDLALGMVLFLVLMFETRRYRAWCEGG